MLSTINIIDLKDKHLLITGGSSGLGRMCAIRASLLGARVTLVARDREKLEEVMSQMQGCDHSYIIFDLSQTDDIESLIKEVVATRGAVDGFCHCAGITGQSAIRTLKYSKPSYIKQMFCVHTEAFIELVRSLSLKKNLNQGASLVGISSIAAYRGDNGLMAYGAAKGAIDSFVKSVAVDLYKRDIRINNVAYGAIKSEAFQELQDNNERVNELFYNQYAGLIDSESAVNIILFLLSDAVKQMTGTTIEFFAGR